MCGVPPSLSSLLSVCAIPYYNCHRFANGQPTTQSKEEHAKGAFLIKEKSKSDQSVHTQVYSAERCR